MRALYITIFCLSLVFYSGETLAESDEICCTWVNSKYVSGDHPQKLIFAFDGTFVTYNTTTTISFWVAPTELSLSQLANGDGLQILLEVPIL